LPWGTQVADRLLDEVELSGLWQEGTEGDGVDLDGELTAVFLLTNLWIGIPLNETVALFAGGGLGVGRLVAELEGGGGSINLDDQDVGLAYQLGAGMGFKASRNMDLDFGYEFKAIRGLKIGASDVNYMAHVFLLGMTFRFDN
jgi:opacity protein-like surface antigen